MVTNTITARQISRYTLKTMLPLVLLILTSLGTTFAHAANITVTTSRNPVSINDSFQLIYEVNSGFFSGGVDGDPDFSPIDKNFDILSSSQTMSSTYINGTWKQTKSWILTIIAKDIGKFTIPAIHFGKDISPAIQITITSNTSSSGVQPKDQFTVPAKIFLEASIDKKQGWVQSQFIYTVRLLRTVSIANASLTEPVTSDSDAIIEQISEDNYQTTRNGISYEVFQRRYAIFPQKSGQLKINPLTFEGRVNASQPRTIFDQFRMSGQLKRLRSNPLEVTVKAAPSSVNLQDWLPAENLQLTEEWSDDIQNINTGDPVTRTITITAEGLTAVQLPELSFAEIDGIKQYPDKPVTQNEQTANGITGIKQFKVALIPGNAGTYTLPAVKLQWWNTKTNRMETASIAQQTITATGNAVSTSKAAPAPLNAQNTTPDTAPSSSAKKTLASTPPVNSESPYWKWLSLAFAVAWLFTLVLYIKKTGTARRKSDKKTGTANFSATRTAINTAATTVEKYARKNQAINTRAALINWAQLFYADKTINNLSQLASHSSAQLAEEVRYLNQVLYRPDDKHAENNAEKEAWNGSKLLLAFKQEINSQNGQTKKTSVLKPLYNQQ